MTAPWKAALVALLLGPSALLGCPAAVECRNYSDCPVGQLCDLASNTCAPDPGTPDPGGGGTPVFPIPDAGPGDGGGGVVARQVRPDFPAPWIERDPRPDGQGHILFADFLGAGDQVTRDAVRSFDPATGRVDGRPVFDFINKLPSCAIERLLFVDETSPEEVWVSCRQGAPLRLLYEGFLEQAFKDLPAGSAELSLFSSPEGSEVPRILVAARGDTSFTAYQLQPSDGVGVGHPFVDTVTPLFGAIGGLYPLDRVALHGDFALVFDRYAPSVQPVGPALVPVQRDPQSETWQAATAFEPLPLGAATHVAFPLATPRADGQTSTPSTPNFMSLEPSTGLARYWNVEARQEILPPTVFETGATLLVEAPAPSERILLAFSPSRQYVFYALTTTYRVWRIPTGPGGDNDVRFYDFANTTWRPSGLVAESDDEVWVSYANENLIERVSLVMP